MVVCVTGCHVFPSDTSFLDSSDTSFLDFRHVFYWANAGAKYSSIYIVQCLMLSTAHGSTVAWRLTTSSVQMLGGSLLSSALMHSVQGFDLGMLFSNAMLCIPTVAWRLTTPSVQMLGGSLLGSALMHSPQGLDSPVYCRLCMLCFVSFVVFISLRFSNAYQP